MDVRAIGAVTAMPTSRRTAGQEDGSDFAAALAAASSPSTDRGAAAGGKLDETAADVSATQGLPAGVYDFTRISPRQMTIVGRALVSGGLAKEASLAGAMDLVGSDAASNTPINMFAYLRHAAGESEKAPGGMDAAFRQRASLAVLTRVQREGDVPLTYDDNYPGAPRSLTPDEIDAKLKGAIDAFRKEASMTPAQRIRRDVLKDMKITEDTLKAMPAAERELAEKKIGEEVARRLALLGLGKGDGKTAAAAEQAPAIPSLAA